MIALQDGNYTLLVAVDEGEAEFDRAPPHEAKAAPLKAIATAGTTWAATTHITHAILSQENS